MGIVAFSVRRREAEAERLEAFARLENFGDADATVPLELYLDDRLINADRVTITPGGARGVAFDLGEVHSGVLRLAAKTGDHLALDDEAWTVIKPPHQANVLLVTPGNEPLKLCLQTGVASLAARLDVAAARLPHHAHLRATGRRRGL